MTSPTLTLFVPGTGHAVAGYAVIFIAFFGYLGWLHISARRLRRRLEALERELQRAKR